MPTAPFELQPLLDRIVIEPDESEEQTPSGLYLPEQAKEKPQQGTVIATGPGRYTEMIARFVPMGIKVGDKVLYTKYSGTEIKSGAKKLLILRETDILAIVKPVVGEEA